MPTDDIDAMTGPELSAAVAREVMGWRPMTFGHGWVDRRDVYTPPEMWQPHYDRNDAHRVLMRCEELGIARDIRRHLWEAMMADLQNKYESWFYLTVDPAIICRAALRAVRGAK